MAQVLGSLSSALEDDGIVVCIWVFSEVIALTLVKDALPVVCGKQFNVPILAVTVLVLVAVLVVFIMVVLGVLVGVCPHEYARCDCFGGGACGAAEKAIELDTLPSE